jgi:hypothetical protein
MKPSRLLPGVLAASLMTGSALAGDISFSGFGTLGYAQSDQSYNYQRFINKSGTFARDSVLGAQADIKLNEQWGATVQAKLAPSLHDDNKWDPTLSWAFISYRPSDDWLFRAGKLRVPLYLNSENMDVGTTFDFARLPTEMYSVAPTTDFTGLSFTKTWELGSGDINLDGYWGSAKSHWRFFTRDDISALGGPARGASFVPITTEAKGLVLTAQIDDNRFRAGVHTTVTKNSDGDAFVSDFSYGPLPGLPFVNGYSPGATVNRIHNTALTLGGDISLGGGYRLTGEVARRIVSDTKIGPDTTGAYLSLLKQAGPWTPYVSVARLFSSSDPRKRYQEVNGTVISSPFLPPGAGTGLTSAQRAMADGIVAYDQTTFALGFSYRLTPTQKIKAEWANTHVGSMSSFVDAPTGTETGHRNINVISASYNFVF